MGVLTTVLPPDVSGDFCSVECAIAYLQKRQEGKYAGIV